MRTISLSAALLAANGAVAFAQEHGAEAPAKGGLMNLQVNLMFWTLILFGLTYFILKRYAFGPMTAAVEAREQALEDALQGAKDDRDAAAKLLEEHRAQLDAARGEGQKLIAEGRAIAEKMRQDLLERTRDEQHELLDRARREIEAEKERAVLELRRVAVDLAVAGASKLIDENLDSSKNRQLVESYLSSLGTLNVSRH
jgi:F-type H+-transporting ATPase subunit b